MSGSSSLHDPDLSWPGADRRNPRLDDPTYTTLRLLRESVEEFAKQIIPPATVLDLGAGAVPYAPLFDSAINYVSVDLEKRYPTRLVADFAYALPFADDVIDAVLCTQVLEHVPDPASVVQEIHRVLKPGGIGLITVPFAWEIHHYPDDCHRFTPFSLSKLFGDFARCDVNALEPSDLAWLQSKMIRWHRGNPDSGWRKYVIRRLNRWMWNRADRFQDDTHPGNLIARIQK
jgi:SAM-dependent methyltransferase